MVRLTSVWRVLATVSRGVSTRSWALVAIRIMFEILPVRVTLRLVGWGVLLKYSPAGMWTQLATEVYRRLKSNVSVYRSLRVVHVCSLKSLLVAMRLVYRPSETGYTHNNGAMNESSRTGSGTEVTYHRCGTFPLANPRLTILTSPSPKISPLASTIIGVSGF
jgi:hypothetical protein